MQTTTSTAGYSKQKQKYRTTARHANISLAVGSTTVGRLMSMATGKTAWDSSVSQDI
jgi:hypothetical protein